jgi:hypothetical protein
MTTPFTEVELVEGIMGMPEASVGSAIGDIKVGVRVPAEPRLVIATETSPVVQP